MAIASGTFSVDTFFFLSGLLVSFLGLREMTKRDGKINVPMMYLGRYLRQVFFSHNTKTDLICQH